MKRVTHAWMIGLVASATMAGAACNRTPAEREEARAPAAETATAPRNDAAITTSVQARYYADDTVRGRHIDVTTENGVVTLRGTVDTDAARQQAVNIAQQVEGVSRVDDQLQVGAATETAAAATRETPPPAAGERPEQTGTAGRTDEDRVQPAWITTKIQAQYFVNREIKPWNIDVTTGGDGVVTLEGEVETAADKSEAVRIARETEGVTRVEDRLRVQGEPAEREAAPAAGATPAGDMQPDAWLTSKVQAKYFMDDEVKGSDINVDTHDGVVTLKGTVDTEAQRRQAVALARNTDGVKDVNDQLQVQPETAAEAREPAAPGATLPPVGPVVDDTWITTKIQSKYFLDQEVKGHQINVDARKGVVTLTGTVETEHQKQQAERIAHETDGVSKVVNNLVVGKR